MSRHATLFSHKFHNRVLEKEKKNKPQAACVITAWPVDFTAAAAVAAAAAVQCQVSTLLTHLLLNVSGLKATHGG